MLALTDPTWKDLEHAYGSAADTPSRLRRLAEGEVTGSLRDELWSSLWHQGDVFSASFAAAPHIVEASASMRVEDRLDWLVLAMGITATARAGNAPRAAFLRESLDEAVAQAKPVVADLLVRMRNWKPWETRYLLGVVAIQAGQAKFGLNLFELDCGVECPSCGSEVDLLAHFGVPSK